MIDKPILNFLTNRSTQLLKRSYMTDACFLYSPSQLALASIIASCHRPGSLGSPSKEKMSSLKSDISLFAEAYFCDKASEYGKLINAVQGAVKLMIKTLEIVK
jgi:hypothetical protein